MLSVFKQPSTSRARSKRASYRPSVRRTAIFPRYVLKSMSLIPALTSFILHIICFMTIVLRARILLRAFSLALERLCRFAVECRDGSDCCCHNLFPFFYSHISVAKIRKFLELSRDCSHLFIYIKARRAEYPHGCIVLDNFCIVSDLGFWEKLCTFAVKLCVNK